MINTCSSLSLFPSQFRLWYCVTLSSPKKTKTHIITVVDIQCTSTFSMDLFPQSFPYLSLSSQKTVCVWVCVCIPFPFSLSLSLFHSGCINKTRKKQYCWCVTTAMKIFISVCLCAFPAWKVQFSFSFCIINKISEGSSLEAVIIKRTVQMIVFSTLTSRLTLLGKEKYISRQSNVHLLLAAILLAAALVSSV